MLQNNFFKQKYITFNATTPGQANIYLNDHSCRTFFVGYILQYHIYVEVFFT